MKKFSCYVFEEKGIFSVNIELHPNNDDTLLV